MERKSPTIHDIAIACGVSAATVSYVLNDKHIVREETRRRVLRAVRDLQYRPSAVARGLTGKHMDTLGVVFTTDRASPISHPYFAPILDGIMRVALREGQNTTLFTGHLWKDAASSLPILRDGRCDGLLLIAPLIGSDIVPALAEAGVPFVLINEFHGDSRVACVTVDDVAVGHAMTTYLIAQGHRRIAMICGDSKIHCVSLRLEGYRRALEEHGIAFDDRLVFPGEFFEPTIAMRVDAILGIPRNERPTALFCSNDEMALLTMHDLVARGVRVPEEMSIAGVDDVAAAAESDPPLTTIRQPLHEIGARATEILMSMLRGEKEVSRRLTLPTELIARSSVATFGQ
jgi:LacI family transcriptional regulator